MSRTIGVNEAKAHLSRLVRALRDGQEREIIIAISGKPCARLVPYEARKRRSGIDVSLVSSADDPDASDGEIEELFTEGPIFPERG